MSKGRPLSEQERARRRAEDRDRLEQAARALLTSDGWQQWIRVRSRNGLSRYSLRNQLCSSPSRRRTPASWPASTPGTTSGAP